jgi:L-iditol 2-dehydrogenase
MSVMMAALLQRPGRIYITDRIGARLSLAEKAGADWTGNPDNVDVVNEVNRLEPGGLDVVFECCGKQEALDQAFLLLKPGGKLMVVGIPEIESWQMPVSLSRHKELCIQHVRRQVDCVGPVLELLGEGKIDAGIMVTHRFGFEETQKAFDLVAGYQDGVMKAMIDL